MWLLFLLLFCSVAKADVYIMTDQNNAVVAVSSQDNAVIPKGYTVTNVKGNISNLPIVGEPTLYNFSNGAFTLNTTLVQAKQTAQINEAATETSKFNAKASAIAKLTDAINKVNPADVLTDQELQAVLP